MNLLFRADANIAMGTGHVMRCLALAQAWQDAGGKAVFAMAENTPALRQRLHSESCAMVDISAAAGTEQDSQQTIAEARDRRAEWVVVDGYQFSTDYQRALKDAGVKLLVVDDYGHAGHYSADLVLNQNVSADDSLYEDREPYTRALLGSQYCLLRREFRSWQNYTRTIADAGHRVLITMGGSDAENLSLRALQATAAVKIQNLEVTVVVGGSNPHFESLGTAAVRLHDECGMKITLRRNVANMPKLMAEADVAISAAGSTCWELCLLGLPALLIDVAENQTALAKELARRECAVHLGNSGVSTEKVGNELDRLLHSPALRQSLSRRSRELVDGKGAGRVVAILRGTDLRDSDLRGTDVGAGLCLRRVQAEDCRLLWEWANDPEVRAASFSPAPISWETHSAWFADKLGKDESLIVIAEEEQTPCGQVRFDRRPDRDWEIDVSVVRTMRGRGVASRLIKLGVQLFLEQYADARIHAFVKPDNTASLKAFENAGFQRMGSEQVRAQAAIHFIFIYGTQSRLNL